MFAKREGTEVISQCHVGRGAHPVDYHHLARRLDDDQFFELEDMFDQDTCRLFLGTKGPQECTQKGDKGLTTPVLGVCLHC